MAVFHRHVDNDKGRPVGSILVDAAGLFVACTKGVRLGAFLSDLEAEKAIRAAPKPSRERREKKPPPLPPGALTEADAAWPIREGGRVAATVTKGAHGRYAVYVGPERIGDYVSQDEARYAAHAALTRRHRK